MQSKTTWIILVIALLLILVGDLLAMAVQTDWGNIKVRDVRFVGSGGEIVSALLYIPKGVTADHPAPGIVAIHGYINSRETQDSFAIEFARRGYVVLAPDQTGHGYTDPPAFADGFGGISPLRYISTLDIVDPKNIGLEGHSMGGWASVIAASAIPDGYQSMVLEGSSTGTYGAPDGTATFPRNLCLVYSQWDEFSNLMWGSPIAKDIVKTDKLKTVFNTTSDVMPGKVYGSIDDGTARILYQPVCTHPWDSFNPVAVGYAVDWFQKTLKGGNTLPPSDQSWPWKEFGNLMALAGFFLLVFPVGSLILKIPFFSGLSQEPAEPKPIKGIGWWIGVILLIIITAVTYFPLKDIPTKLAIPATAFFPQNITTQIMFFDVVLGIITAVLFLLWHFVWNRKTGANGDTYGLSWDMKLKWSMVGKSLLVAALAALAAYITLSFSAWAFTVDYRIWIFAVKPLSPLQFQIFLCYLIPFALLWIPLATLLHGELRPVIKGKTVGLWPEMIINALVLVMGYVLIFLFQYIPLMLGGTLALPDEHLFSIIAITFLLAIPINAFVLTYFFRKTGHIYVGAFLVTILMTAQIVAAEAIHFAF
ncbi:MAG: alpha/beta hydrolase family protein [Dehalococcoidia bacterium]